MKTIRIDRFETGFAGDGDGLSVSGRILSFYTSFVGPPFYNNPPLWRQTYKYSVIIEPDGVEREYLMKWTEDLTKIEIPDGFRVATATFNSHPPKLKLQLLLEKT